VSTVGFNIPPITYIRSFLRWSRQAITCTGTDNKMQLNNREKHVKPNQMKPRQTSAQTDKANAQTELIWYSRLVRHPTRKRIRFILATTTKTQPHNLHSAATYALHQDELMYSWRLCEFIIEKNISLQSECQKYTHPPFQVPASNIVKITQLQSTDRANNNNNNNNQDNVYGAVIMAKPLREFTQAGRQTVTARQYMPRLCI